MNTVTVLVLKVLVPTESDLADSSGYFHVMLLPIIKMNLLFSSGIQRLSLAPN